MDEKIQIVDKDDQPLGYATREEAWAKGLVHRLVRIMIFDQDGRILLQKRSTLKKKYPGMWTDAATGHVDYGETYETAAPRELSEEIGISAPLMFLGKFYTEDITTDKTTKTYHEVFSGTVTKDTPIKLEEGEVSEIKWFDPQELRDKIAKDPDLFTPGVQQVIGSYL
jgi:isopentenyl-diphosphate delta-isomerase type 1